MKRTTLVIGFVLLLFALNHSALPTLGAPPAQTTTVWTGYYFANRDLQGEPVFIRDDPSIDFAWGSGSPGGNLPADDFSVRWTRWLFIDAPGAWTFTTITDDGVRLFIDDTIVIDAWNDQTLTARSVTLNLSQSFHLVRMEYYERSSNAAAHLFLTAPNFPDWRGEYYSNPNLAGAPTFARNDSAINFNFGTAGPGGGVPGTNFSARWTQSQYFNAGRYRFTTTTDDGVRLWVDGQLLIDQWKDQTLKSGSAETNLTEGNHWLRLDYFQRGGAAQATLTWATVAGSTDLWRGEYFNNPSLDGSPAFARDDAGIDFDWGAESPGKGIPKSGDWSARWSAQRATSAPGFYTATAIADDGVRVWVDGNLLIDQWHDQSPTAHAAMTYLAAGQHDWRIEYYQHGGGASLRVQITPGAIAPEPSPQIQASLPPRQIVIDAKSNGFIKPSADSNWKTSSNGAGGLAYSIKNNAFAQSNSHWIHWYPALPHAGKYQVEIYIPAGIGTTQRARYWLVHAGDFDSRLVNQSLYTNQWVSLGTYYFSAAGDEYVALSDATFEPALSTVIVADAMRFSVR